MSDGTEKSATQAGDSSPIEMMEIDTGRSGRWKRSIGFVLLFLCVCGALVWVMTLFNAKLGLAIGLVAFMVGYMLLMGHWASGKIDRRE